MGQVVDSCSRHKSVTVVIDVRFLFKHAVCHSKSISVTDLSRQTRPKHEKNPRVRKRSIIHSVKSIRIAIDTGQGASMRQCNAICTVSISVKLIAYYFF